MKAIDFNLLKRGELYTIAGGPGYTIPFGLYKCDGYGATKGDPIQIVDALELVRCDKNMSLMKAAIAKELLSRLTIRCKRERYSCDGCKQEPANITNVNCSVCDRFPGFNYCEHPTDMWEENKNATD